MIQYQVVVNVFDVVCVQLVQEQLEIFQYQFGIVFVFEDQVVIEYVFGKCVIDVGLGFLGIGWFEDFECGICGYQFYYGGWIEWLFGIVGCQYVFVVVGIDYYYFCVLLWDMGYLQCVDYGWWQVLCVDGIVGQE